MLVNIARAAMCTAGTSYTLGMSFNANIGTTQAAPTTYAPKWGRVSTHGQDAPVAVKGHFSLDDLIAALIIRKKALGAARDPLYRPAALSGSQ